MLPSLGILIVLTWVYLAYGDLPVVAGLPYGIKPAVTAIVVFAAWRIGSRALRGRRHPGDRRQHACGVGLFGLDLMYWCGWFLTAPYGWGAHKSFRSMVIASKGATRTWSEPAKRPISRQAPASRA